MTRWVWRKREDHGLRQATVEASASDRHGERKGHYRGITNTSVPVLAIYNPNGEEKGWDGW